MYYSAMSPTEGELNHYHNVHGIPQCLKHEQVILTLNKYMYILKTVSITCSGKPHCYLLEIQILTVHFFLSFRNF
jgi:hypothetical protein